MIYNCRVCGVELDDENWILSGLKNRNYICKVCTAEHNRLYYEVNTEHCRLYYETNRDKILTYRRSYRKNNPDKVKANNTKHHRSRGGQSMRENKKCSAYIGVYINEGLLKHYFNDVEGMPYGHPGYDFICNNGWKIDAKSSATGDKGRWTFRIDHNIIADYFFCVAYDNREDLNIIHIWLLPGDKFNHLVSATISKSTIDKWAEYEKPIDKAIICCDSMKNGAIQ